MPIAFAKADDVNWAQLDPNFPTSATGWQRQARFDDVGTHFGFTLDGPAHLSAEAGDFSLGAGMYFSVAGPFEIEGGRGLVVTREQQRGLFQVGGPIEANGRLQYMDGCSDTLLLSPPTWGDACLNLLVMPPGTRQRMHEHPSVRVGVIASGHGECVTDGGRFLLSPGLAFNIPPRGRHCFHTEDETLRVIAYHPDTDFGPRDEDHPMRNRTVNIAPAGQFPSGASETPAPTNVLHAIKVDP